MEKPVVKMHEKNLSQVFATGNRDVATRATRLAVLYEDLRVEYEGAKFMGDWEGLDINGGDYRRLYFIRRSLVTMIEFSGAISRMNEIKEWRRQVESLSPELRDMWNDAVKYFSDSHKRLEEIRGDLGGHFKERAAEFAITHFLPESTGSIEIRKSPERKKASIRFAFTHEVVAVALRKTMNKEQPTLKEIADFMSELFTFITEGWKHAVSAVTVIGGQYFMPQFK